MPPRALVYRFYAKAYGWTEKQVDEDISLDMHEWYGKIEMAHERAAEMRRSQESRPQGKTSRHF